MFKKLTCNHSWKKINELLMESQADVLHKMKLKPTTHTSFIRKSITDYCCVKCGKLKRFTTTN